MDKLQSRYERSNEFKGSLDSEDQMNKESRLINQFDSKFLRWLTKFHNVLSRDKINVGDLGSLMQGIKHIYEDQKDSYLEALLYPEYVIGARVPRIIPVKAAAYKSTYEFRFQASTLGTFCLVLQPFVHNIQASGLGNFWVNNDNTLTGNGASNFFTTKDLGYFINPIYSESCLVSHSIVVDAQVNSNTNSGTLVSGIVHDPAIMRTGMGAISGVLAKYGDFTLARTGFFNDSVNINSSPGIRAIGFPIDNSFEEFNNAVVSGAQERPGFAHVFTGIGLTPSTTILVKVTANWECLPDPAFVNIMPTSYSPKYMGSEEKSSIIQKVQRNPIGSYDPRLSMIDNVMEDFLY